ncbi:cell division protein ZipA [Kistimonas asteriae]|uniref:cell division protein ZipA n=1 Tax=Kistimonas asteriae TaxID=517724 RepID=UPI001BAA5E10|nr:cell division protein ZipA [Kistimonas asteriae]
MSFRDWLIILGVLAVVLIIADGFRRVWLHRRRANELNFGLEEIKWQDDEFSSELPNGGARAALHGELDSRDGMPDAGVPQDKRVEPFISDFSEPDPCNVIEDVPVERQVDLSHEDDGIESEVRVAREELTAEEQAVEEKGQQSLDLDQPVPVLMDVDDRRQAIDEQPDVVAVRDKPSPRQTVEAFSALDPEPSPPDFSDEPHPGALRQVEEVLIINLMARKGESFAGSDLLSLFISEGLRFGEMNIFHRHIQPDGQGDILYSVANGVEPGTFNLKTMEQDSTSALSFFMGLPGPEGSESMQAFRIMVEAVYHIAEDLGGVLKDERHSVLTQQTLEHYRQRISDFERRRMTHRRNNKARV